MFLGRRQKNCNTISSQKMKMCSSFFVVFSNVLAECANARPFLCQTSPGCINVNNPFVACVILDIYNKRARGTNLSARAAAPRPRHRVDFWCTQLHDSLEAANFSSVVSISFSWLVVCHSMFRLHIALKNVLQKKETKLHLDPDRELHQECLR